MARAQKSLLLALVLGLCVGHSAARMASQVTLATKMTTNPVRKVVVMLQDMQTKIQAEGKEEQELFDKFMCYCSKGASDLEKSVEEANTKVPQLESDVEKTTAQKTQLEEDIAQAEKDKAAAVQSLKESVALREKAAADFEKESTEMKGEIEALGKAIEAEENGMAGSFLQSAAASTLGQWVRTADLTDSDRETVSSFLSSGEDDSDSSNPAIAETIATLKQLQTTEKEDLAELTTQEEAAVKEHEALVQAKKKEIGALTSTIQTKTARLGEVGEELINMKDDLDDTKKGLGEDATFLQDMERSCATKKQDWEARSKTRTEELLALADTIKILNDDDALDLFKKALPSTSLLQLQVSSKDVMRRTREVLGAARHHDARLNLISMATRGKAPNFDKIFSMIDGMVTLLKKEQGDEDNKKGYCEKELDSAEDEEKNLKQEEEKLETEISEGKGTIEATKDEIASLAAGMTDLDKKVVEAEELRKKEHAEYQKEMAESTGAKKLLVMAKDRMNQFYNQGAAVPARETPAAGVPGAEAPTEEPAAVETPAAGVPGAEAPALVQVARHMAMAGDAPPPPPETFGAYSKKGEESTGVISMMDLIIKDLETQITEAEVEEKNSQADYEKFVAEAKEKRATDTQALESKEAAKAQAEELVFKSKRDDKTMLKQMMDAGEYVHNLHGECDWLLQNFEVRKEARGQEVDSLQKAKAVLSGADMSLVQVGHSHYVRKALRG